MRTSAALTAAVREKKRIDVWLIYRCLACEEAWNLPIFERVGIGDIEKHRAVDGVMQFAGVDDHYFIAAAIPAGQQAQVRYDPVAVAVPGSERGLQFISWSARFPSSPSKARFFAGPKDFDVLRAVVVETLAQLRAVRAALVASAGAGLDAGRAAALAYGGAAVTVPAAPRPLDTGNVRSKVRAARAASPLDAFAVS